MTALAAFLILAMERFGFRPLEAVISAFVGVVALSYVVETILDKPAWNLVFYHAVVPQFRGSRAFCWPQGSWVQRSCRTRSSCIRR